MHLDIISKYCLYNSSTQDWVNNNTTNLRRKL